MSDFSGQAHVFIRPEMITEAEDPYIDRRRLQDVKTQGLAHEKNFIDQIYPLSFAIIHEVRCLYPVSHVCVV